MGYRLFAPEEERISSSGRKIIAPAFFNNVSQKDLNKFVKWARKNGWKINPTYSYESQRRAATLTNGRVSFSVINRVTLRKSPENPQGHRWDDDRVIVNCDIACFIDGQNLARYGIYWYDFMNDDAELLLMMRVQGSVGWRDRLKKPGVITC